MLTDAGIGIDDLPASKARRTTTVAMDFGRITINDDLVLYLFGTPGPGPVLVPVGRAGPGALGAVVLADTRRLADCFPSVDYFERRGTPFVVAVNCFDGAQQHSPDAGPQGPRPRPRTCRWCSATPGTGESGKEVFVALVEHVMATTRR